MAAAAFAAPTSVYEVDPSGVLTLNLHQGQQRAFWADERFVLILAGTQSGKTSIGPAWLFREIQRRGPGDYLIGSPTYPLMEIKVIPEFKRFFQTLMNLGEYVGSPLRKFTLSPYGNQVLFGTPDPGADTHIYFGYGTDPDSLESATYKAAWLDEAGQKKFKLASWEAILRRLAIAQGRVLITTTPYTLGWLKSELHDKAATDPDIALINFPSIANPMFQQEEYDRARRTLPGWKFNMFYRGVFDRPAGLIYDCFDRKIHTMERFTIPGSWPRFIGVDFGGVHTAAIFFARELSPQGVPTGRYIGYREYLFGGRTSRQHVEALMESEPRIPSAVGGSFSEGQWRSEFASAGLPVRKPPISDVEVGINRVYAGLKSGTFVLFDDLVNTIDQLETYSRVLDDRGEPTEKIEDKETYHYLDAWRYIGADLVRPPDQTNDAVNAWLSELE
jgi:hypothetical protein